eukprot:11847522-Karenia_brevis.AAC.1
MQSLDYLPAGCILHQIITMMEQKGSCTSICYFKNFFAFKRFAEHKIASKIRRHDGPPNILSKITCHHLFVCHHKEAVLQLSHIGSGRGMWQN